MGMPITVAVERGGESHTIAAQPGELLSDLLRRGGFHLPLPCGGGGRCGQCRVRAVGELSPPGEAERTALGPALDQGMRLACLARIQGNAAVRVEDPSGGDRILGGGAMPAFRRDPLYRGWGAAVDIGTTTLSAQLYGPGGLVASATCRNPQGAFGADVISRIQRALEGESRALAGAVRGAITSLLEELCAKGGVSTGAVDALVLAGNTAMLYLLCARDPEPLSRAPFQADCLYGLTLPARELDLPCAPGATVYLPRCFSAFVGADVVVAILASGMLESKGAAMLADIGTNGEVALWRGGELLCCSTAAGPAFEGASIRMGMPGTAGAIDRVWLEGEEIRCSVIGGAPPVGICGSGIVDAVATLRKAGVIDESGALEEEGHPHAGRILEVDGETAVRLAGDVVLTGRDVRMVQLAKSALRAGMETLLETGGVQPGELDALYIAGGFGSYVDLDSAAAIGLIPPALGSRARVIGNAAQTGASMLLENRAFLPLIESYAALATPVDLSSNPLFTERYMEGMIF